MPKKRSFLQKVRRKIRRKQFRKKATQLEAWLNDRTPNPSYGGKSPYDIFRAVGIRTAWQLKNFLDLPDMQMYLTLSGLQEGDTAVVTLRGVKYRAIRMDGQLRLTDDLEMYDRVDAAFERAGIPKKFDNALEVQSWIDSLPKWGMPADIPVKRQVIVPVKDMPTTAPPEPKQGVVLPTESRLAREAKKVSDTRFVNGHATADALVDKDEYAAWLNYARKDMPEEIQFGRDLNASITMIGKMVKVHWFSKNELGDKYLQVLLDSLKTYDGKLTNPITGEKLSGENSSVGTGEERNALLPPPDPAAPSDR